FKLAPNVDDVFILRGAESARTKYQVRYTTNRHGRRVTFSEDRADAGLNILLLGCSITFGEGVNNEDAFPSKLGALLKERTYNLGVMGSSPSVALHTMLKKKEDFLASIAPGETIVIYNFIDDHLMRI